MDPPNYTTHNGDICLVDYATTHTILWNKKYFSNLTFASINVNTISSFVNPIQGFRRAIIVLLGGIKSLMMHYILLNPKGIFLVSKIFVEMDIILKLWIKII